jgi:hypothetical protein
MKSIAQQMHEPDRVPGGPLPVMLAFGMKGVLTSSRITYHEEASSV